MFNGFGEMLDSCYYAFFICLLGTTFSTEVYAERVNFGGYEVIELDLENESQANSFSLLSNSSLFPAGEIDFWSEIRIGAPTYLMVPPRSSDLLKNVLDDLSLQYSIAIPDVQRMIDREEQQQIEARTRRREVVDWNSFNTFDEIVFWLKQQAASNPEMVELVSIGSSTEGRPILIAKISKKDETGAKHEKPKIWLDCGIHAREWAAPPVCTFAIDQLLRNETFSDLLSAYEWYIMPIHNPDGYSYTSEKNRMWRKNRSKNHNSLFGCDGIDLNRNYGTHWDLDGGASDLACSESYRGSAPFSAPETRVVKEFAEKNLPELALYVSLHSFSQLWMPPWAYTAESVNNLEELTRVGQIGADALHSRYGTKFTVGAVGQILYLASGSSMDWFHTELNVSYSYVLELRPTKKAGLFGFFLPLDEILPCADETWTGLTAAAREILKTIHPRIRSLGHSPQGIS